MVSLPFERADRILIGAAVLVGLCLFAAVLAPHPFFAGPYVDGDAGEYTHFAVSEDDSRFAETVELYDLDPDDSIDISELTPAGAAVFLQTINASEGDDGWSQYELQVCEPWLLTCDTTRDAPTDFTYGVGSASEIFTFVTYDERTYILQTGLLPGSESVASGPSIGETTELVWLFGILPYVVFMLAGTALSVTVGNREWGSILVVGGTILFIVGLVLPYVELYTSLSVAELGGWLPVTAVTAALFSLAVTVYLTVRYAETTVSAQRRQRQ
ncbi:hypothetical protein [Natronocalculus amylovorans]|uniref:Uncharacterized protein n=1 Tax=Natronocalculus amylovorans TaxID=2917812 RepID=A0AAE3K8H2_9EURY|nr:hypothetical protein [Natronocalculus amylovorans]MCL9817033.1 hypothetical protein [Natronocalculus amylovorans]